jgi:hypothetical protein
LPISQPLLKGTLANIGALCDTLNYQSCYYKTRPLPAKLLKGDNYPIFF